MIGVTLAAVLVRLGRERTLVVVAGILMIAGPALVALRLYVEEPPPQPLARHPDRHGFRARGGLSAAVADPARRALTG